MVHSLPLSALCTSQILARFFGTCSSRELECGLEWKKVRSSGKVRCSNVVGCCCLLLLLVHRHNNSHSDVRTTSTQALCLRCCCCCGNKLCHGRVKRESCCSLATLQTMQQCTTMSDICLAGTLSKRRESESQHYPTVGTVCPQQSASASGVYPALA